jgi:hypothetical protein
VCVFFYLLLSSFPLYQIFTSIFLPFVKWNVKIKQILIYLKHQAANEINTFNLEPCLLCLPLKRKFRWIIGTSMTCLFIYCIAAKHGRCNVHGWRLLNFWSGHNNVQDCSVLYDNAVRTATYVRLSILLTCRKRLYDRIISLWGVVWAYDTSFTPPLFIVVPVPSLVSELSCICVLGYSLCLL